MTTRHVHARKPSECHTRIAPLVQIYESIFDRNEFPETVLTDLLADLMHWADAEGIDWSSVHCAAAAHHDHEAWEATA